MTAAKSGIVAEYKIGYLQRALILEAIVSGGTDSGLRDSSTTGFAVRRLVQLSTSTSGVNTIASPTTAASATSIGSATHIIAQADDTIRDEVTDYNYPERYTTVPNSIVKNSTTVKTVALYPITDSSDIELYSLS